MEHLIFMQHNGKLIPRHLFRMCCITIGMNFVHTSHMLRNCLWYVVFWATGTMHGWSHHESACLVRALLWNTVGMLCKPLKRASKFPRICYIIDNCNKRHPVFVFAADSPVNNKIPYAKGCLSPGLCRVLFVEQTGPPNFTLHYACGSLKRIP